jgi:alpha-mannosidase
MFRFILRPHRRSSPAEAARLATGFSQPLLPFKARGAAPSGTPRLRLTSSDVLVAGLKPSDDGRALIVRLWAASGQAASAELVWADPQPRALWMSDTSEKPLRRLEGSVTLPPWGVAAVRAELAP